MFNLNPTNFAQLQPVALECDKQVCWQLIKLLSDGQFYTKEKLAKDLSVCFTKVDAYIAQLKNWAINVQFIQEKGYALSEPIDLLDESLLEEHLAIPSFFLLPEIDSTNQFLLDRIDQLDSACACLAEYQFAGRGRRGKTWLSPFAANLYLSLYRPLQTEICVSMGLSLVVGVAMAETLTELGGKDIKVKWPNDLYYQDKKLAGILVEMITCADKTTHLVIGMGLNLAMTDNDAIDQPWVNFNQTCDLTINKSKLAASVINGVNGALLQYEKEGLRAFIKRWEAFDNFYQKPVSLWVGKSEKKGVACGINEQGALLLKTKQGITPYFGNEISLRFTQK